MSKYFIDGLTKRQIETFEQIAIGNDKGIHPKVADNLVKRGLLEKYYEISIGGGFRIIRYKVPIPIHAKWCAWCADSVDIKE